MHSDTEKYNKAQAPSDRAICQRLAEHIDRGLPEAENKIWHGHPVWFLDGNSVVGYSKLKSCFLVAFRCKGRQFCPSCHARRLAEWSLWLDERLLAPVAHRQVVLTIPKRLRAYFIHDRRRLGLMSRVATRTLRAYVQTMLGEHDTVPGLVMCVQTFGSVAHLHPHLHVLLGTRR